MKRFGMKHVGALLLVLGLAPSPARAQTNDLPQFQELLRVLRANLPGVTEDDLNRVAVQGLLDGFRPRVQLATNVVDTPTNTALISRTAIYDRAFGYLRVAELAPGLPEQFDTAWGELLGTNRLKGLVLDLRFARGDDYRAAAAVADRFLTKARPLIGWGEETVRSTAKARAIELPLAVLVNHDTAGAAEALAEALRATCAALLVGSRTAGQAYVFKEFELANQQHVRVASTPVQVGDDKTLDEGAAPDIDVAVNASEEKAWFADAFRVPPDSPAASAEAAEVGLGRSTNRLRPRLNEAELVRRQRERSPAPGPDWPAPGSPAAAGASGPVVQDPALARALDVLRAIALVGRSRPS
jgi:hypothetical protein